MSEARVVSADEARAWIAADFVPLTEVHNLAHTVVTQAEQVAVMLALLGEMVDPEPCWFDHNGGCQAHGYISLEPGETCPQADAKALLAASGE